MHTTLFIYIFKFISELCSSENLPEVEIFSLLEEQIPKYKVRSDFLTDFSGYSNQDWFVPTPALEIPTEGLGLTKEQTRETLNYFRKYLLQFIMYLCNPVRFLHILTVLAVEVYKIQCIET